MTKMWLPVDMFQSDAGQVAAAVIAVVCLNMSARSCIHYPPSTVQQAATLHYLGCRPNWNLKDAVEVGYQTACGLASLHGRGYVHGDFKPDNIGLMSEAGGLLVKLLDLGRTQEFDNCSLTWRSGMP